MAGSASIIPYMGIIAVLITMLGPADAIVGYDCDTKLHNTTTISSAMINDCEKYDPNLNMSSQNITLLQLNEFKHTIVMQCKIEIQRSINKCKSQKFNSSESFGYNEYILPISRKDCEIAHDHGTLKISNMIIDGLKVDAITTRNVTLAGSVGSNDTCTGEKYSDPYGAWDDVVVTGKVKVTLKKQLFEELPSAYQCKFNNGKCMDSERGYTFWSTTPERSCSAKKYSVLYNGTATKIKSKDGKEFSVMIEDVTFFFRTMRNKSACGVTFYKTEYPKLFIVKSEDLKHLEEYKIISNEAEKSDIFQYGNDKIDPPNRFMYYSIQYAHKKVMKDKCERENEILKTALAPSSMKPDELAFKIIGGPGYMAVMDKNQFHIVQCVPVEVKLQQQDKCYNRLSILRRNQTLFLTPWTHIITNNAIELPCNSKLLQDHKLNSTTYKVMPKPEGILEPERLKLRTKLIWKYQDLANLGISGMEMLTNLHQLQDCTDHPKPLYRPSIENYEFLDANGNIPNIIFINDHSANDQWYNTWNKLTILVLIFVIFIGIIVCIYLVMVIDNIFQGSILRSTKEGFRSFIRNIQSRRQRISNISEVTIAFNNKQKE